MAVAVGVIAFAEDAAVFFRSELRVVIDVRCREFSFAREINHASPAMWNLILSPGPWLSDCPDTGGLSMQRFRGCEIVLSVAADRRTEEDRRARVSLCSRKNGRGEFG